MLNKKMLNKKIKNTLIVFMFFAVIFGLAFFVSKTQAGIADNTKGWMWGGGTEIDGMAPYDGINTNVRWISANNTNTGSAISYGVNIPAGDGELSGNAWSGGDDSGPGLGYITFDKARLAGCPAAPCSARRVGNALEGWARFEEIAIAGANSGGWLGWIKLKGTTQDNKPYGIMINSDGTITKGQTTSYAWSDELGWIDFSRFFMEIPKTLFTTTTANPQLVASNTTPVSVTANVTGGTASGDNIKYELDCTSDGSIEETYSSATGELTHTFNNACTYNATSNSASVRITRDGVNASNSAQIIFGCIDSVCDTSSYSCVAQINLPGQCNSGCNVSNCQRPRDLNWKEVNPN